MRKKIGKSGIEVSGLGMGCWAIGGPFTLDGLADGWGAVDDWQSIAAIHCALDAGIDFFDTADVYGTGHSEKLIGAAVKGRRDRVVLATKFGYAYEEDTKEAWTRYDVSPAYIRQACERSLKRLQTDYIDLYQIHVGVLSEEETRSAIGALEQLKRDGLIRSYGWSTWDPSCAKRFAAQSGGDAIQHTLNVLNDPAELVDVCESGGLASINNTPLAMGLLSGKFDASSRLPADDVRGSGHSWVTYFKDGAPVPSMLNRLDNIREALTEGGRTLAQGALGWIWARSDAAIPIPGIRTEKQAEELAQAMAYGPLPEARMNEIRDLLRAGIGAGE
ncbi:aldo/keto reductase [Paenibacillaceae bacterium WGS1546]|uniref:aldo/keto reductase n=1 Tax=Cohnella sp. WGS1546 TaxID=3366810 RepID=UPI00372D6C58